MEQLTVPLPIYIVLERGTIMNESFKKWLDQGHTLVLNGLLKHYHALGLTEAELVFVIQLQSFIDIGMSFPDMRTIAHRMGKKEAEIFNLLHTLIQKNCISITSENDESGKVSDRYSIYPLYQKLMLLFEKTEDIKQEEKDNDINLLEVFQQEFGRLLTPIEMQTISEWLDHDHYSKEIILEALREAVLNQSYSLKYIDRILLSWEKKNIRTSHQAKTESKRFQARQSGRKVDESDEDEEDIPLFNWLESSD